MSPPEPVVSTLQQWVEVFMRRSMRNFIRYAHDSGLSMSQIGALFHIHQQGCSGVGDMGDHLGVSNAAASQMLERLVQQGLVSRAEDPNDRRAKQIALTERGRQVVGESIQARQSWLEALALSLSPAEKEQVDQAIKILIQKAASLEPSNGA
jgi:DNA-binding MarR family transcriptional regulator